MGYEKVHRSVEGQWSVRVGQARCGSPKGQAPLRAVIPPQAPTLLEMQSHRCSHWISFPMHRVEHVARALRRPTLSKGLRLRSTPLGGSATRARPQWSKCLSDCSRCQPTVFLPRHCRSRGPSDVTSHAGAAGESREVYRSAAHRRSQGATRGSTCSLHSAL